MLRSQNEMSRTLYNEVNKREQMVKQSNIERLNQNRTDKQIPQTSGYENVKPWPKT